MKNEPTKSLQIQSNSFLHKIRIFIRNLFLKKSFESSDSSVTRIQTSNTYNQNEKEAFLNSVKIGHTNINPDLLELQNKFENREITISELTTSQINSLKELYNNQVSNLHKVLDDRQTELAFLKLKLGSSNK